MATAHTITHEQRKASIEYAEGLAKPFCACGRRWSDCDGSRRKCHARAKEAK